MGDNTQITTQSALGEANFVLQEFANNLGAHSNSSLSAAHGIDTFPALNPDSVGNDRTYFEDSRSNIVGTRHVRIIVDGVSYWVPGQDSVLAGQPAGTNITNLQGTPSNGLGAGDDNWVTVFEQQSLDSIVTINTDYLLTHIKKGHWEAHGGVSVTTETTLNSAGYEIGDTIIKLSIGGVVYKIPAHTRFGGPIQWWSSGRISTDPSFTSGFNVVYMGNTGDNNFGYFYYRDNSPYKGTRPRTVTWQLNSSPSGSGSWHDIPTTPGATAAVICGGSWGGNPTVTFWGYTIGVNAMVTGSSGLFCTVSTGENYAIATCCVRAKITTGGGLRTTYTGLCQLITQDEASGYLTWYSTTTLNLPFPGGVPMYYVGYNQFV